MDATLRPFIKTINPEDLPAEAWNIVLGKRDDGDLGELYRNVSWLFRAVDLRCNGVASVPFSIYQGDDEIDTSDNWQNVVKFLPNPGALFGLIEMALTIWGCGYLYKRPNLLGNRPYSMRYLPPMTVQVKKQQGEYVLDDKGRPMFTRTEGGREVEYSADQVVYFWHPDPFVEWGPPTSSPAIAASLAAGVVLDVNLFASAFLQRGAIKPLLLGVKNPKKQTELDKLKDFMNRLFSPSRKKSYPTEVLNIEEITITTIGEGLEAIAGKENQLTDSKRQEIATALGIPHSILFSGAANYSVSEKDDVHFYDKTIVPDCRFIQSVMNDQVFTPLGYRMEYRPESMDIFQEDEEQRATSLNSFMDAIGKADTLELAQAAFMVYGYEIPEDAMKLIKAHYAKKDERRAEFGANIANLKPGGNGNKPDLDDDEDESGDDARQEMNKWLSKIKHRWTPGKAKSAAAIPFEPEFITPGLHGAILGALESCKSISDVEAVFAGMDEWIDYPSGKATKHTHDDNGVKMLALELSQVRDQLNKAIMTPEPVEQHLAFNFPATRFEVPAPVVNNTIQVEPTPVTVTNQVNPTPVTVENQIDVNPAAVSVDNKVNIPADPEPSPIRLTVIRDRDGKISEVVEEE